MEYLKNNWIAIFPILISIGSVVVAYMRFFMGKVYTPRVDLSLDAEVVNRDGRDYLLVTSKAKNTGNTRIHICPDSARFILSSCDPFALVPNVVGATWKRLATTFVFESHECLDTGEEISEQTLLNLPLEKQTALKIEYQIKGKLFASKNWGKNHISSIVILPDGATL